MKRASSGMTLLEVVIALTILSTLMIFSSTSIQQALNNKLKIQNQLDDMSRVRDALRVIEKDVNLAYHPPDLEMEVLEALKRPPRPGQPAAPPTPIPTPNPDGTRPPGTPQFRDEKEAERRANRVKSETQFIGSEDKMYFATLNAGRVSETARQADYLKVGYYVDSCTRPARRNETNSGECLFRSQSPIADGDFTKGGTPFVLLENVAEFKLRYKFNSKDDWVSEWKSIGGDGRAMGKFPTLVEVTLVTEKGTQTAPKRISMVVVAAVRFPNNPEQRTGQPGQAQPGIPSPPPFGGN